MIEEAVKLGADAVITIRYAKRKSWIGRRGAGLSPYSVILIDIGALRLFWILNLLQSPYILVK